MAQSSASRRISYGDVTASMLAAGVDPALSMGPTTRTSTSMNIPLASTPALPQRVPGTAQTLRLNQQGDLSPVSTTHVVEVPMVNTTAQDQLLLQNLMHQRASLGVNALPLMRGGISGVGGDGRSANQLIAAQSQGQQRLQLRPQSLGLADSNNTTAAAHTVSVLDNDQVAPIMNMSLAQITAYQQTLESELMASQANMQELRTRMMNEIVLGEQALAADSSPIKPNPPIKHKKQERRPSMGARAA